MENRITAETIEPMELVMNYHESMKRNGLNLIYQGEVNQSITKAFTSLAEEKMHEEQEEKSTIRKVYHVMVECLQNIYKHGDKRAEGRPGRKSDGIFLVGHDEEGYIVSTGNEVPTEKVPRIKELLEMVNSMSPEELKEYYKTQIRDGDLSEKGGAGLGFVDMCRKTGNKLSYKFETIDENITFFILKTYIAK